MKKILKIVCVAFVGLMSLLLAGPVNAEEIEVEDTQAPIISGVNSYSLTNQSKVAVDSFVNALTIIEDSEYTVTVVSDDYSSNYKIPGEYHVVVEVKDAYDNTASYIITILVKDGVGPVFYDVDGKACSSLTVHKSSNALLTVDSILKKLTCIDDVDGQITTFEVVEDNYTGFGDKTGDYQIKINAIDSAGNATEHIIYVVVISLKDVVVYEHKKIVVDTSVKLEKDDFADILKVCGYYPNSTTTYINVASEAYEESYDVVGNYPIECKLSSTNGTEKTVYLTVEVIEHNDSDVTNDETPGIIRFAQSIVDFFVNAGKKIWEFLCNLFD